ncbi:hypothetical protein LL912_05540 [Niabella sp. CC-SYL272]|uniref:hypothetical protein n=1 Tax=Niabella agricola TaxID=2891571 RepID=UPI001F4175E0|nr:hypothetical protein [Niabella agricola]MCF3108234.1 hypothetical protein [Niabella agricola]
MKKVSILFAAVIAIAVATISWKAADNAAVRITDFGCGFSDGNGNPFFTDNSSIVITSSGNGNFKCQASGVPNSTGKAVKYGGDITGGWCFTQAGITDDWQEVISADGNATLICKVHPQ